jgi:hypothetical protein
MREFLKIPLGRDIAAVLALKLAALYVLWVLFFSNPAGPPDADAVARAVTGRPAVTQSAAPSKD